MSKAVDLQNKLIDSLLPMAMDKLKQEQNARVELIAKIVQEKKEDSEFFESPSAFMGQAGIAHRPVNTPAQWPRNPGRG